MQHCGTPFSATSYLLVSLVKICYTVNDDVTVQYDFRFHFALIFFIWHVLLPNQVWIIVLCNWSSHLYVSVTEHTVQKPRCCDLDYSRNSGINVRKFDLTFFSNLLYVMEWNRYSMKICQQSCCFLLVLCVLNFINFITIAVLNVSCECFITLLCSLKATPFTAVNFFSIKLQLVDLFHYSDNLV